MQLKPDFFYVRRKGGVLNSQLDLNIDRHVTDVAVATSVAVTTDQTITQSPIAVSAHSLGESDAGASMTTDLWIAFFQRPLPHFLLKI